MLRSMPRARTLQCFLQKQWSLTWNITKRGGFSAIGQPARQSSLSGWLHYASCQQLPSTDTQRKLWRRRQTQTGGNSGRAMSLDHMNLFARGDSDMQNSWTIVESYNSKGFVICGTLVPGAVLLLPQTVLHWNAKTIEDVTWESLSVIRILSRKPGMACYSCFVDFVADLCDENRDSITYSSHSPATTCVPASYQPSPTLTHPAVTIAFLFYKAWC